MPNQVPAWVEERVVAFALGFPGFGPRRIAAELRRKCRSFRANSVDICWLVDPSTRSVEFFEADRDGGVLGTGASLETPVMPGFSLPLEQLFAAFD